MKLKLVLLLFLLAKVVSGQQIFTVNYFSTASTMGFNKTIQISDSSFLSAGNIAWASSSSLMLLTKTAINGDTIWTKTYGTPFNGDAEFGIDLVEDIFTKNIFLLGSSVIKYSLTGSTFASSVLCLDSAGNILWTKTYGDSLQVLRPNTIQLRLDNLFISGDREMIASSDSNAIFLMSIDKNTGNINWSYDYGDSAFIHLNSSVITATGEHLIIGARYTDFNDLNTLDAFVIKLDSSGNFFWSKVIYSNVADWGLDVIENNNGNYVCLLKSKMNNPNNKNNLNLVELDTAGNFQWSIEYSFPNQNLNGNSIKQLSNSNFFIGLDYAGTTTTNGVNYLLTDSIGNLIESGFKASYSLILSVEKTIDNGLILCTGVLIIKTDSSLNGYCYQKLNNVVFQSNSNLISNSIGFHSIPFSTSTNEFDTIISTGFQINWSPFCQTYTTTTQVLPDNNLVSILPNPATDFIEIKNNNESYYEIRIINVLGEVILSQVVQINTKVDISSLPKGLYILQMLSSKVTKTTKFIKA